MHTARQFGEGERGVLRAATNELRGGCSTGVVVWSTWPATPPLNKAGAARCPRSRGGTSSMPVVPWSSSLQDIHYTENDSPQPQAPLAFGLWNTNSARSGSSYQSMVVPITVINAFGSMTTCTPAISNSGIHGMFAEVYSAAQCARAQKWLLKELFTDQQASHTLLFYHLI